MGKEKEFNIVMPFDDQSHSFAHGFECGQIWEKMKLTEKFESHLFHTQNKKQVENMCKRFHYTCKIETIDEYWSRLTAEVNPALAN